MNDTVSLLLATAILAAGGLGLYMYKNPDEDHQGGEEDELFGSDNFWGSGSKEDDINLDEEELDDIDEYEYKPKSRLKKPKTKTKTNRKSIGTKRRY